MGTPHGWSQWRTHDLFKGTVLQFIPGRDGSPALKESLGRRGWGVEDVEDSETFFSSKKKIEPLSRTRGRGILDLIHDQPL